ncbi:MAG: RHS repeat-associated core domain-containing protein, partial [Burkholderiales bacterium]
WRWDSDPFGTSLDNSKPIENPQIISGTATVQQAGSFKQNLRFPGQLADGESAKYYNYFRDYDSSVGRYLKSDPIGLGGGINTFGYTKANPIHYRDVTGLTAEKPPNCRDGNCTVPMCPSPSGPVPCPEPPKVPPKLPPSTKCHWLVEKVFGGCTCADTSVSLVSCLGCCSTVGGYFRSGGSACAVRCNDKYPTDPDGPLPDVACRQRYGSWGRA